jgi:two-component system LytT family response regulator
MKKIVTIIADDEPPSLRILKKMLSSRKDLRIAAECPNGNEAIRAINRIRPDLAFLDIQMPGCNGLEILDRIQSTSPPMIVFVTAFDQYAVKAFEANALDYVLKPYDQARIDRCLNKIERHFRNETKSQESRAFPFQSPSGDEAYLVRMLIRKGNRIHILRVEDIDWIGAAGDYIEIHSKTDVHLMHEKLREIERRLDPRRFQRIHRSTIVNIERVAELEPLFHRDHAVILRNGRRLTLSRTFQEGFFNVFSTAQTPGLEK